MVKEALGYSANPESDYLEPLSEMADSSGLMFPPARPLHSSHPVRRGTEFAAGGRVPMKASGVGAALNY